MNDETNNVIELNNTKAFLKGAVGAAAWFVLTFGVYFSLYNSLKGPDIQSQLEIIELCEALNTEPTETQE